MKSSTGNVANTIVPTVQGAEPVLPGLGGTSWGILVLDRYAMHLKLIQILLHVNCT